MGWWLPLLGCVGWWLPLLGCAGRQQRSRWSGYPSHSSPPPKSRSQKHRKEDGSSHPAVPHPWQSLLLKVHGFSNACRRFIDFTSFPPLSGWVKSVCMHKVLLCILKTLILNGILRGKTLGKSKNTLKGQWYNSFHGSAEGPWFAKLTASGRLAWNSEVFAWSAG